MCRVERMLRKRLRGDLRVLHAAGCAVEVRDAHRWRCVVSGPAGTPYENADFPVEIVFPASYPFHNEPLRCTFAVRIFHCNVDANGRVCAASLPQPMPSRTVRDLLQHLEQLLAHCHVDDPLVPEIADLYRTNRKRHDAIARAWTRLYAGASPLS